MPVPRLVRSTVLVPTSRSRGMPARSTARPACGAGRPSNAPAASSSGTRRPVVRRPELPWCRNSMTRDSSGTLPDESAGRSHPRSGDLREHRGRSSFRDRARGVELRRVEVTRDGPMFRAVSEVSFATRVGRCRARSTRTVGTKSTSCGIADWGVLHCWHHPVDGEYVDARYTFWCSATGTAARAGCHGWGGDDEGLHEADHPGTYPAEQEFIAGGRNWPAGRAVTNFRDWAQQSYPA